MRDIWLPRFDQELEAEKASRRKGRPKSTKEHKLEEQKLRETEGYRTGIGECSYFFFKFPTSHAMPQRCAAVHCGQETASGRSALTSGALGQGTPALAFEGPPPYPKARLSPASKTSKRAG